MLRELCHPNVIAYHESFVHEGVLHIVMDYAGDRAPQPRLQQTMSSPCRHPAPSVRADTGLRGRAPLPVVELCCRSGVHWHAAHTP